MIGALPLEIQYRIGEYLLLQDIYRSHHVLQSDMIHSLQFPMICPIRSDDVVHFCHWLYRWRRHLCRLRSIRITHLLQTYRSAVFEILSMVRFLNDPHHIYLRNVLTLFDDLSPRLFWALRSFLSKFHSVRNINVDSRLLPFCMHMKDTVFTTISTWGTKTIFYENGDRYQDSRNTCMQWIHHFEGDVVIWCVCFQTDHVCRTMSRIPVQKRSNAIIIHQN